MPSRRFESGSEIFLPSRIKRNIAPKKNRQNARVNGGMFCKLSLKIAAAAPQIILEIISAKIAFWTVFNDFMD